MTNETVAMADFEENVEEMVETTREAAYDYSLLIAEFCTAKIVKIGW